MGPRWIDKALAQRKNINFSLLMFVQNQFNVRYLKEKSRPTTTVTDAKVIYRMLLSGQCYTN